MKKILVTVFYKDNRPKMEKRFASLIEMKLQVEIARFLASLTFNEVAKVEIVPE